MVFTSLVPQISLTTFCDSDWARDTHDRMKHLAIDYHFVRDLVASKKHQVSHCQEAIN